MNIMVDTSLGIYFQFQTQLSIVYLKGLMIFGTQEYKYQQENSFRMLLKIKITWYQKNNGLIQIPRMLKFLHYQLVCQS